MSAPRKPALRVVPSNGKPSPSARTLLVQRMELADRIVAIAGDWAQGKMTPRELGERAATLAIETLGDGGAK